MLKGQAFKWHTLFSEEKDDIHDNSWSGQLKTAKTHENAEKVQQIVSIEEWLWEW
jgi:hypothetical protein